MIAFQSPVYSPWLSYAASATRIQQQGYHSKNTAARIPQQSTAQCAHTCGVMSCTLTSAKPAALTAAWYSSKVCMWYLWWFKYSCTAHPQQHTWRSVKSQVHCRDTSMPHRCTRAILAALKGTAQPHQHTRHSAHGNQSESGVRPAQYNINRCDMRSLQQPRCCLASTTTS